MHPSFLSASIWASIAVILLSAGGSWADQRFPVNDPSNLSPPNVVPPVHDCALAVSVSDFRDKALVTVFADGVPVGADHPTPDIHGNADIALTRPLVVGETLTATQTVDSIPSGSSYKPFKVTFYPTLTTPVVIPDIYQCGRAVGVGNLVASTHVDVWDTAAPPPPFLGSGEATKDWLGIGTSSLATDHLVRAQQTACPSLPKPKSAQSDPLKVKEAPNPPPAPTVEPSPPDGPKPPGVEQVTVDGLLTGAQIQINYGATPFLDGYATSPRDLVNVPPVPPAPVPVTAVQTLCTSSPPSPPVTAKNELDTPVLGGPICAGDHYVTVDNADPGTTAVLLRSAKQIGSQAGHLGTVQLGVGIDSAGMPVFLADGDQLSVVQYKESPFGTFYSPVSNQVTVGCDGAGNVVTQHNNNQRTGVYSAESTLTPGAVLARGMRIKYTHPVDGQINAQPLYVRQVEFPKGGANGLFIAAYFSNKVYALNADTGDKEWDTTLVDSDPSKRGLPQGIDSTPVIDVPNHRIYVAFSTKNQTLDEADQPDSTHPSTIPRKDGKPHVYQDTDLKNLDTAFWVVALDYRTGKEMARTMVSASMYRQNGDTVRFEAPFQRQRPALLLDHGMLYVAFGAIAGSESFLEYHGWVMSYRAYDLSLQASFNTSRNYKPPRTPYQFAWDRTPDKSEDGSGIWQGGGGLAADRDGNIFFLTGNGTADPANDKFGDSFIKLVPTGSSLIPSAFIPSDAVAMENKDADFGAGGALLIPDTDFVIGGGKTGFMYLLDGKSMTHRETITASTNQYDPANVEPFTPGPKKSYPGRDDTWNLGPHLHGSPSYWLGTDPTFGGLYVWGEKDFLRLYRFDFATGLLEDAGEHTAVVALDGDPDDVVMPGGVISISSDRNRPGTGIVWATLPASDIPIPYPGRLYAFDAQNLQPLWDTGFPALGHWAVPTIADGKVFVGTSPTATSPGVLICYELGPDTGAGRTSWIPFQPLAMKAPKDRARVVEHQMHGHWDESVMTSLPRSTLRALAPTTQAVKYAALVGGGDAVFTAKLAPTGGKLSWAGQGSSLRGDLTLASNLFPEQNKIELKVSPELVWTASDGSAAESRLVKSYTAPENSDANWELYQVTHATERGILAGITYIQRVFTKGGRPPEIGPRTRVDTARVPFAAEYILYR